MARAVENACDHADVRRVAGAARRGRLYTTDTRNREPDRPRPQPPGGESAVGYSEQAPPIDRSIAQADRCFH